MSPTSDEDDPYRRIDEALGRRPESDPWAAVDGTQTGPVPPPPGGYEAVREAHAPAGAPDVAPAAPAPPGQPSPATPDPFRAPPDPGARPDPFRAPPDPGARVDPFRAPPAAPAGPSPYGPQPVWPQARPASEPYATAALICGVISMTCLPITGPVGIGLGTAALRRLRTTGGQGRGVAIAGVVTGSIGTLFLLAFFVLVVSSAGSGGS